AAARVRQPIGAGDSTGSDLIARQLDLTGALARDEAPAHVVALYGAITLAGRLAQGGAAAAHGAVGAHRDPALADVGTAVVALGSAFGRARRQVVAVDLAASARQARAVVGIVALEAAVVIAHHSTGL